MVEKKLWLKLLRPDIGQKLVFLDIRWNLGIDVYYYPDIWSRNNFHFKDKSHSFIRRSRIVQIRDWDLNHVQGLQIKSLCQVKYHSYWDFRSQVIVKLVVASFWREHTINHIFDFGLTLDHLREDFVILIKVIKLVRNLDFILFNTNHLSSCHKNIPYSKVCLILFKYFLVSHLKGIIYLGVD